MNFKDNQALAFVEGQAYQINQRVYETRYPDWDFSRLIFVDTTAPEWSPGIVTYSSDFSGAARWQSSYAKDIPLADVSQDYETRGYHMAAIGYQWNLEEVNTTMGFPGANLPDRRARSARLAYQKFMYDIALSGNAEKSWGGLINYPGVTATDAPNDGNANARVWYDATGVGQKTPAQIVRDINLALAGVHQATNEIDLADTILLPTRALQYIAETPYNPLVQETILSFVMRTNLYTITTGQALTIRGVRELDTGDAGGSLGRLVAYKNNPEYVKLHLPMPHRFLPVYQDGPLNFVIPGIFRTGGVELLTTAGMRYIDKISTPIP